MTATERRVGSSRRGMTVLGKVPVAPKPINLPSQRLENQGLIPDVDIVPRGMCSWGSTGRIPGARGNTTKKSDSTSSFPISSGGEQGNGGKVESKSVLPTSSRNSEVNDGGGLPETTTQFSSAKTDSMQALNTNGKIDEPTNSNSYARNSLDSQKRETIETPLQQSGDRCVQGVSVPPGFGHCGPHGNHSRAGVSTSDLQSNGIGPGMYPNTSQQNGFYNFPGVPQQNGKREREIIVIHMVGSPGSYGNYLPQFGYPDNSSRSGLYGNFPLQFGNFEPFFGFQGHGRLEGGAQIAPFTGSGLFDEHEDFVCYEKECYLGRQKNGMVRGVFHESTLLSGGQKDVHDTLVSRSSLKSRCTSQKHLSRNVGRRRPSYNNGRLVVPIEEVSAVPEKRITLLTKVSQHKILTTKSIEEAGIGEVAHAEGVFGSVFAACENEGKAPETLEADTVTKDSQVTKTDASPSLKMADETSLFKETQLGSTEVLVSAATCNDECLHCKAEASTLQCCLRPAEEVSAESIDKSNSTDGCVVEVKHVIFDGDSSNSNAVKSQECSALSSSMEDAALDNFLDTQSSTMLQKSPIQDNSEGNQSQRSRKGVTEGKWKPKRVVRKVDFKVLAPKIRKAAIRKNTSKTFSNECVSEASSPAMCNMKDSMSSMGVESSQTEACKMQCQVSLLSSSLSSSGNISVVDSHVSKEEPNGAPVGDFSTLDEQFSKDTPHKDCHDNVATVHVAESQEGLVKVVFEGTSSTEALKGEVNTKTNTNEKVWRPKVPTTKVSSIRVSKAYVYPRKLDIEGTNSHAFVGSMVSAKSSEVIKEQGDAVQLKSTPPTSQLCDSEALKTNTSQSFTGASKNSSRGQQNLVFRERSAEKAALVNQSSRDPSNIKQPIGSLDVSSKGMIRPECPKNSLYATSSHLKNAANGNFSVSDSEYHMVRRRVYHVVEGSGADYFPPSLSLSGKSHQTGNCESFQASSMQNQKTLQKKTSSVSSYCTESVHSEEIPESICMSWSSGSESIPHLDQVGVAVNQHTSGSLVSSSGSEESRSKKHVGPVKGSSAWKPKAAPKTSVLENVFPENDNNKSGPLMTSSHGDGALKGIIDSVNSIQISASSNEEYLYGLPLELQSGCHETLEEINCSLNQEDTLQSRQNEHVVDSQKVSEIVISMEGTQQGSAQKYAAEVLCLELLCPVSSEEEEEAPGLKEINENCSRENTGGNHRPFKKKNVMSYEKANRYHQMMFKKYKETGHWKPKTQLHL